MISWPGDQTCHTIYLFLFKLTQNFAIQVEDQSSGQFQNTITVWNEFFHFRFGSAVTCCSLESSAFRPGRISWNSIRSSMLGRLVYSICTRYLFCNFLLYAFYFLSNTSWTEKFSDGLFDNKFTQQNLTFLHLMRVGWNYIISSKFYFIVKLVI